MIAAVAALSILLVAGCGPTKVHTDHDWVGGNPCSPGEKRVQIDIDGSYPTGDQADPVYVDPNVLVDVLFDGFSPDPEYGGVMYVGTGLSQRTPGTIEVVTPYYANACFRADRPVAIMLRAWLAAPTVREAGVGITCAMHDEGIEATGIQKDYVKTDAADIIPPGEKGFNIIVQCVYIHVPGDWTGEPMPEKPFPTLDNPRRRS